jgi:lipopolysaccharide transport system permease protein
MKPEQQGTHEDWDLVIEPRGGLLNLKIKELVSHAYLMRMFVRRDFVSAYKQTILGPLWFFIQPLLTTLTFTVIFGNVAKISTDGLPQMVFYMAGVTIWNYFSETLTETSNTFIKNANLFGKVYFPRLVMPITRVVSGLMKFGIQFVLFLLFLLYYMYKGESVKPDLTGILLVTPLVLLIMAGIGLGIGMILSALTTKYRDLVFLISFGVQLLMYATPVIYPMSSMSSKYKWIIEANPLSWIVEAFRKVYLGTGLLDWNGILYSICFMVGILLVGIITFNKVERTFIDNV